MTRNFRTLLIVLMPLFLYFCAQLSLSPESKGQNVEMTIRCISPNFHVVEVDGHDIWCSQAEFDLLKKVDEVRSKRSLCLVSLVLANNSDISYIVSEWDLRAAFIHSIVLTDDQGTRWRIRDTFRTIENGGAVYKIACVAKHSKTFVFTIGLSELVREGSETPKSHALPLFVSYSSEGDLIVVGCREINGTAFTAPTTLNIVLPEGRCAVSETGCP